uniref:Ketoyl reductase domain protein n=2 Tax=Amphidinium carterae TaxID=2961 RepID=B4ZG04_AMPCA|nr:ketoyl reductase domain protein [Amphidinium carterae]
MGTFTRLEGIAYGDLWKTGQHNYTAGSQRDTRSCEVVYVDGIEEHVPFHTYLGPQVLLADGSSTYMQAWPRMTSTEKEVYLMSVARRNRAYMESTGTENLLQFVPSSMCYVPAWCAEHWPIEDAEGLASKEYLEEGMKKLWQPSPPGVAYRVRSQPERVLVFADAAGLCEKILATAPKGMLAKVEYVNEQPKQITVDKIKALYADGPWDLLIFGSGLDPPPDGQGLEATISHLNSVSELYLNIMTQALRQFGTLKRLACLTRGVFTDRLQGDEGDARGLGKVASGTLFGMSNSLRAELPQFPVHYIDFDWQPLKCVWKMIMSELFSMQTFGLNTVRISGNKRYVLRTMPATTDSAKVEAIEYPGSTGEAHDSVRSFNFPAEGVIAVTGGSGSLAVVFAGMLVDKALEMKATYKIQMLSRSGKVKLPDDIARFEEVVKKAETGGIQIEEVVLDVGNKEEVDRWVAKNSPHITGVIHTAGVLKDAMLMGLTWEKFHQVLEPKTHGALYLHDALERHSNPKLTMFWVFSSVSAYGNAGQVNYAGANTALDALVRYRRARGLPAHSLQWGAWAEAGMFMSMREEEKQNAEWGLCPPFTNAEALRGLEEGLRTGLPVLTLWKYNLSLMLLVVSSLDSYSGFYMRNYLSEMCVPPTPGPSAVDTTYAWVRWHRQAFHDQNVQVKRRMLTDGSC